MRAGRSEPVLEARICRIVQEAVANVKRLARSERSETRLTQVNDRLYMGIEDWGIEDWGIEDWGIEDWGIEDWGIEDWGIGFDPAHVTKDRFGLQGIRERARLLRGRAVISSAPGKGARVFDDLPVGRALSEVASTNSWSME